jgi:hypothetical protein
MICMNTISHILFGQTEENTENSKLATSLRFKPWTSQIRSRSANYYIMMLHEQCCEYFNVHLHVKISNENIITFPLQKKNYKYCLLWFIVGE